MQLSLESVSLTFPFVSYTEAMEIPQWEHTELREGKLFLMNMTRAQFKGLDFSSKRMGVSAHDGEGNPLHLEDWFPIFIEAKELSQKSIQLQDLRISLRTTLGQNLHA